MQGASQSSGTIPKPTAATTVGAKRSAVSKRVAPRKRRNVKLRFSDLVYVALCCGIGGEIIGFARAGIKCRAFWDICHLCVHIVSQYCDGLPIADTVHNDKVVTWLNKQFAILDFDSNRHWLMISRRSPRHHQPQGIRKPLRWCCGRRGARDMRTTTEHLAL